MACREGAVKVIDVTYFHHSMKRGSFGTTRVWGISCSTRWKVCPSSSDTHTVVVEPSAELPNGYQWSLTREAFEQMIRPLLERTLEELQGLATLLAPGTRAGRFLLDPQVSPADRRRILIELHENPPIDEGEDQILDPEGHVVRIFATRGAVRAMAEAAVVAVGQGRPPCPLCEFPMDPDGHVCPRWN